MSAIYTLFWRRADLRTVGRDIAVFWAVCCAGTGDAAVVMSEIAVVLAGRRRMRLRKHCLPLSSWTTKDSPLSHTARTVASCVPTWTLLPIAKRWLEKAFLLIAAVCCLILCPRLESADAEFMPGTGHGGSKIFVFLWEFKKQLHWRWPVGTGHISENGEAELKILSRQFTFFEKIFRIFYCCFSKTIRFRMVWRR